MAADSGTFMATTRAQPTRRRQPQKSSPPQPRRTARLRVRRIPISVFHFGRYCTSRLPTETCTTSPFCRRYRATTIVRYLDKQGRALRRFEVCDHHAELTIRREQLRGLKVNDLRRSP